MIVALMLWQQAAGGQTSVLRIWIFFLALGAFGFLLCRVRFWLLPLALVMGGSITAGIVTTLRDPTFREIIAQQAPHYPAHAYAAIITAFSLCCFGAWRGWSTRAQTRK